MSQPKALFGTASATHFSKKNQKNPAKRFASNARSTATLNAIKEQMNEKRGKHEKRGSSRIPLLRSGLPLATVPNRA